MNRIVRAIHRAVRLPGQPAPYDTLHARVYYPGRLTGRTGEVEADADAGPFPVVVLLPELGVGPESYRWLAQALADRGYAFVTYSHVAEVAPGRVELSPGIDPTPLRPDSHYGHAPTAIAVAPLLDELGAVQASGPLAGLLDLERLVLGGHGQGGAAALHSAALRHFGGLSAVFAYAAHAEAPPGLEWPEGWLLPLPGEVPLLLLGGERDRLLDAGRGDPLARLHRTFTEAFAGGRGDAHMLLLAGANHSSFCHPEDPTTAPLADLHATAPGEALRAFFVEAISAFLDAYVREDSEVVVQLEQLASHPLVLRADRR